MILKTLDMRRPMLPEVSSLLVDSLTVSYWSLMTNRISLPPPEKETRSESCALRCSLDQSGYADHREGCSGSGLKGSFSAADFCESHGSGGVARRAW